MSSIFGPAILDLHTKIDNCQKFVASNQVFNDILNFKIILFYFALEKYLEKKEKYA